MANKYFTQLTQLAAGSVASGDAIAIEDISAGETKYITSSDYATYVSSTLAGASGGWDAVSSTWTYYGSTIGNGTVSIPSGGTLLYSKGDKVKFIQGGTQLYFSVIDASSGTTLTITGGSDYTLGTAAISSIYYSKTENPLNFPHWFTYTSTVSGTGGSAGAYAENLYVSKFRITGNSCRVHISKVISNVGSWSGSLIVIRPFAVTAPTIFTSLQGGVWTGAALAPKGYLNEADGSYYFFAKTITSTLIAWTDMLTGDVINITATTIF